MAAPKLTDPIHLACGFCMTGRQIESGKLVSRTWPDAQTWFDNCAGGPCVDGRARAGLPPLTRGEFLFFKDVGRMPTDEEYAAIIAPSKKATDDDEIELNGFTLESEFDDIIAADPATEGTERVWLYPKKNVDKPQTVAELPDDHWLVTARYEVVEQKPDYPHTTTASEVDEFDFSLDDDAEPAPAAAPVATKRVRKTKSGAVRKSTRLSVDDIDIGDFEL